MPSLKSLKVEIVNANKRVPTLPWNAQNKYPKYYYQYN